MKFLLLTNNDTDGVGQQAISLGSHLEKKGHKSKIVVLHKTKENSNLIKINRSFATRSLLYLLNFLKKDFFGLFSFGHSTVNYDDLKYYVNESDVVIIYSLYKMISNKMLNDILQTKKVVYFRPLDMELITGGCHANIDSANKICQNFKTDCNNCPLLHFSDIFNLAKKNLIAKKDIFLRNKPRIFVPNTFAKEYFVKSRIFNNFKTQTVFSSTDLKRVVFYSKKNARKKLKIDQKSKILLFISFDLDSPHKGGLLLKESLKMLSSKIKEDKSSKICLITVGRKNSFTFDNIGLEWKHLGLISSIKKLNLLYRASDLLVCPSTYDTGPHCVTEALLNDLPVVAFKQGVAKDTVVNGGNGYLVPCFDKIAFSKAIFKVLYQNKNKKNLSKVKKIKSLFHPLNEANTIINLAKKDLRKI